MAKSLREKEKLQSARNKCGKSPLSECHSLLNKVKKLTYSKAFLQPIDWKQLNIPNQHPMDLSTIENKLNNAQYRTPYDFANDMRLIYQNATTLFFCKFKTDDMTLIYDAALKFAKQFEEEFERKIIDRHETNDFTQKIAKCVSSLIKRDDSVPFRAPVDPQVLEIPDYLDVIDNPMDLGTIMNKIHFYTEFKQFVDDLFLVWDNCCRYNPKQNKIHQIAVQLREYTIKRLNTLFRSDFKQWEEGDTASLPSYPPSSLTMNIIEEKKCVQQESITNNNSSSNNNKNVIFYVEKRSIFDECDEMVIARLLKKQELNPEIVDYLDFQQKEELQRGIQCLDSEHFDPLINMLQSFIPDGAEDDEVELDVDAIDDPLQVKMYNYMLKAVHQQEMERIKREKHEEQQEEDEDIDITNNDNNDNKEEKQSELKKKRRLSDIDNEDNNDNNDNRPKRKRKLSDIDNEDNRANKKRKLSGNINDCNVLNEAMFEIKRIIYESTEKRLNEKIKLKNKLEKENEGLTKLYESTQKRLDEQIKYKKKNKSLKKNNNELQKKLNLWELNNIDTLNLEQLNQIKLKMSNKIKLIEEREKELIDNKYKCIACMERPKNISFTDGCAHIALCDECESKLTSKVCPLCSTPYTNMRKVNI